MPEQRPPSRSQTDLALVSGSFATAALANLRLAEAANRYHLVSPATSVGSLPVGCELVMSAVLVDPERDTYDVGMGKRALHKAPLERVAASVGVSWMVGACRRVDDGSNPHYCHYEVAAQYRAFDGQLQVITGSKEMDLRDGSQRCEDIISKAKKYNANPRNRGKNRDPQDQIRQERANIMGHAETKAKLRAIRSLGLNASYTPEELAKPFVCARIMFTGHSDDPETRRMFESHTAAAFLGATSAAYGAAATRPHEHRAQVMPDAPALPPAREPGHKPPAIGTRASRTTDERDYDDDGVVDMGEVVGDEDHSWVDRDAPEPAAKPAAAKPQPARNQVAHVIPGGPEKDVPLAQASTKNLNYWANRLRNDLDAEQSRDAERDQALFDALLDEIQRREQG